jgi:hypothetical protein
MSFNAWNGGHGQANQPVEHSARTARAPTCIVPGCNQAIAATLGTVYCICHGQGVPPVHQSQPRAAAVENRAGSGPPGAIWCTAHARFFPISDYFKHLLESHSHDDSHLPRHYPSSAPNHTLPPMRTAPPPQPHDNVRILPTNTTQQATVAPSMQPNYEPQQRSPLNPWPGFLSAWVEADEQMAREVTISRVPARTRGSARSRASANTRGRGRKRGPNSGKSSQNAMPKRDVVVVDLTGDATPPPEAAAKPLQDQAQLEPPRQPEDNAASPAAPLAADDNITTAESPIPPVWLLADEGSLPMMDSADSWSTEDLQHSEPSPPVLTVLQRSESPPVLMDPATPNLEPVKTDEANDTHELDTCIYQQDGARSPPPGVVLPSRSVPSTSRRSDKTLHLPTNPLIHRPYTRSEEWFKKKATEIENRPKRKYWFGKAAERQRWLSSQANQAESGRRDPEPWKYNRPLDFGDVPPEKLPQHVRENPDWVKACAWHRDEQQMEILRRRERQRLAEQVRRFYEGVVNAPRTTTRTNKPSVSLDEQT